MVKMVKNPPGMQETQVRFLGREDPLEKGMATHTSILPWRTPWTEEAGSLQSLGSQELDTLSAFLFSYQELPAETTCEELWLTSRS